MRKPAAEKGAAQSKLHERHQMVLTIDMTELNFQRLAALMLFADHVQPPEPVNLAPFPWEEPETDPKPPAELELDYEEVRRGIIKRLEVYVKERGRDQTKRCIQFYGGQTLSEVPQNRLMDLYNALA